VCVCEREREREREREHAGVGNRRVRVLWLVLPEAETCVLENQPPTDTRMENNVRDVFIKGDCDDGALAFAEALGWAEDLAKIIAEVDSAFKASNGDSQKEQQPKQPSDSEKKKG